MQESMSSHSFHLTLPDDFDDYEWLTKGYFIGAVLEFRGTSYPINFYSPQRLLQDIKSELQDTGVFLEQNMVVVREIRRQEMLAAIGEIVSSGRVNTLVALPISAG